MTVFFRSKHEYEKSKREYERYKRDYERSTTDPDWTYSFAYRTIQLVFIAKLVAKDFAEAFFKIFEWSTFIGILGAAVSTGYAKGPVAWIVLNLSIITIVLYGVIVAEDIIDCLVEARILPKLKRGWLTILILTITQLLVAAYIILVVRISARLLSF